MTNSSALWLLLGLGFLYAKKRSSAVIDPVTGLDITIHPVDPAASVNRNVESPYAPGYDLLADPARPQVDTPTSQTSYVDDWFNAQIQTEQPNGPVTSNITSSAQAANVVASAPTYNDPTNPFENAGGDYPREQGGVWVTNPNDVNRLYQAWINLHQGFAY